MRMEWMPIESAPVGKSHVIDLWVVSRNPPEARRYADCWGSFLDGAPVWHFEDGEGFHRIYGAATHWMPLPPPPGE